MQRQNTYSDFMKFLIYYFTSPWRELGSSPEGGDPMREWSHIAYDCFRYADCDDSEVTDTTQTALLL